MGNNPHQMICTKCSLIFLRVDDDETICPQCEGTARQMTKEEIRIHDLEWKKNRKESEKAYQRIRDKVKEIQVKSHKSGDGFEF